MDGAPINVDQFLGIRPGEQPCVMQRVVQGQLLGSSDTYEACNTVVADPSVEILNDADIEFRAGNQVVFSNGFSIEAGSKLAVEIDPALRIP